MPLTHIVNIKNLLKASNFVDDAELVPMPSSGSNRIYYRVNLPGNSVISSLIASFNPDVKENIAHSSFTNSFRRLGFNVPKIYASDETGTYFLLQDLGNTTLLDVLQSDFNQSMDYYKKALANLVDFQVDGPKELDMDAAYPVRQFNKRSVLWDLNYFKYYFVKPNNISFDENKLEDDFNAFADLILNTELTYFNYRDFQARNIMIYNDEPWFIDFQGGRLGPLQYDVVSLLYQAKANLSQGAKDELLGYYLHRLNDKLQTDNHNFMQLYPAYIYFRLMQVMGAYGNRGLIERKAHFLQSIPFVIDSLSDVLARYNLGARLPELENVFKQILSLNYPKFNDKNTGLTVSVNSFSFKKKGIPIDITGNGGGHVFDCRSLPNPGRLPKLRDFTGMDKPVIDYLKSKREVADFLKNAKNIVLQSVVNYRERKFNNLQINFGCTGGRHRSVYTASVIADFLKENFHDITVVLTHCEQPNQD